MRQQNDRKAWTRVEQISMAKRMEGRFWGRIDSIGFCWMGFCREGLLGDG